MNKILNVIDRPIIDIRDRPSIKWSPHEGAESFASQKYHLDSDDKQCRRTVTQCAKHGSTASFLKSQTALAATHHPYPVSGINYQTHFINQILITSLCFTLYALHIC